MFKNKFFLSQGRKTSSFSRVALIGFVCLAFVSLSFGAKPAMHGKLSVLNAHICGSDGKPVQMRGMSMYGWANAGGYSFYTPQCIANLYSSWRCHIIRIPYMASGSISQTVYNAVVQACVDSGMYAIIDWHEGAGSKVADASAFFTTMATKWHGVPNVLYEPWNEPSGIQWTGGIKPYMETVIKVIRAIDPSNIIICGNPNWDQEPQLAAADPITDATNIAYSMHFYSGSHPVGSYGPGITTAMSKGCAVFITEYGACNTGTVLAEPQCTAWYTFLDQNQIGSTCWAVEYLDQCLSIFTKSASNTGPWATSVITGYGTFIQAYILKGTDTPGTEVSPYESKSQQRTIVEWNDLLTGTDKKSAVFTINGERCPVGNKLSSGLHIVQAPGNSSAKVVNGIR
jgi:endoglucanase